MLEVGILKPKNPLQHHHNKSFLPTNDFLSLNCIGARQLKEACRYTLSACSGKPVSSHKSVAGYCNQLVTASGHKSRPAVKLPQCKQAC